MPFCTLLLMCLQKSQQNQITATIHFLYHVANSIPFAQRTSGLEVIGESEKATNLKQINVAQINCKLHIWVWGDSGTKKRERKNINFRSASAMGFYFHLEYFKATLSPMLHSGHDVPFVSVCLRWSYAFPFMGFCFSVHRRFFFQVFQL